ncbi:FecR family protein [Sphingobacterium paludis]|uniref:FecR family protein n=1 Tax=Sphingobacterium paludis TaxID=1476465 RepID=A0A4R7D9W5_9SPHI|nr:FecR family protein [Sphingobacterium paludis]TDS17577.1 FecR family protein [Sphingobacterium paludis]
MEKAKKLLRLYIKGGASPEQRAAVEQWYKHLQVPDSSGYGEEARAQQLAEIRKMLPGAPRSTLKEWVMMAVAACIILTMAIHLLHDDANDQFLPASEVSLGNDIAPGDTAATLTMADGTKINLSADQDGEIVNINGLRINKTADGQLIYQIDPVGNRPAQWNTLSTSNGQTYTITLPDKSKVWLNAASSLTYNTAFAENQERRVVLRGEAFFDVSPDKKHPFVVVTEKQEIRVVGTQFNINSYTNEPAVSTTLVEGAIQVLAKGNQYQLRPGEQCINTGSEIRIEKADIESVIDWKAGDFNFHEEDFRKAMQKIARWYDVEVIYDASLPEHIEARGWVSRNRNLSSVLKLIESSGLVRFKIEGRKVFVR